MTDAPHPAESAPQSYTPQLNGRCKLCGWLLRHHSGATRPIPDLCPYQPHSMTEQPADSPASPAEATALDIPATLNMLDRLARFSDDIAESPGQGIEMTRIRREATTDAAQLRSLAASLSERNQPPEDAVWKAYRTGWLDGTYRDPKPTDSYERLSAEAEYNARLYCKSMMPGFDAARSAPSSSETETIVDF